MPATFFVADPVENGHIARTYPVAGGVTMNNATNTPVVPLRHLQFLVAMNEAVEARAVVAALREAGAVAITDVRDGHMALRQMKKTGAEQIHVAILDLELAGADALELMRALGALASPVQLIVLGVPTSSITVSLESLAQAYGIELLGTIVKPACGARLQALLAHYAAPAQPVVPPPGPRCSLTDIKTALKLRQFIPFFQPKILLATGQVTGLEAFARWRHPTYGVLGPEAFIDAFETNWCIGFLDWSMIEQSVAHCRRFHDLGRPVTLSINLAPATLAHGAFITQITACLRRHQMLPDYVTLELPESSVLTHDPAFIERLVRLRMMGFGLAIDDYGTGRSNLQLLAQVPFSELKIDRSFVDGASKKQALSTVLTSCLTLARSLDRMSVAVGVETRQDWDFLQKLGCTYAQGFYIANPMAAEAFPDWLEEWENFF